MPLVAGVSFKKAGKIYYFDPSDIELHEGDYIIAETSRGVEFGEVMIETKDVLESEIVQPLKKIIRKATASDFSREDSNTKKEKQAMNVCQERIQTHSLPMKLIDADYCFDGSQVTFYFSSESRVDFRELVKDLASALKTKVQLHQVGVRDEAKLYGGIGPCGRALCCTTFMCGFEPVSMKMAKEQSLFLNPLKFSGTCGKLMCCLKYEYPIYKEVKSRMPALGSIVNTPKGSGKIVDYNVIKETLSVEHEDGIVVQYTIEELSQASDKKPENPCSCENCPVSSEQLPAEDAPEASKNKDENGGNDSSRPRGRRRSRRRPNKPQ